MLDHIDAVLNESMSSFKSKTNNAVSTVGKCASHLDEVANECGIVTTVRVIAGVEGGAMVIWGTIAAPFTGGLSLGLTLGGTGLGVVGGVTNITAVVNIIKVSDELMTICVHAFTKAQEHLQIEKSKKLRLCRRKPPATVDTYTPDLTKSLLSMQLTSAY